MFGNRNQDLPKAYDGCTCVCHTTPGVMHFMACCGFRFDPQVKLPVVIDTIENAANPPAANTDEEHRLLAMIQRFAEARDVVKDLTDVFGKEVVETILTKVAGTFGLPPIQSAKYTTNGYSLVHRETGEIIPHNEPVFIIRAKDPNALNTIAYYSAHVTNAEQIKKLEELAQQFMVYACTHPIKSQSD